MIKKHQEEMTEYLESFVSEFESKYDKKIQILLTDSYEQIVKIKKKLYL